MIKKAVRQKIKDLKEIIDLWVKFNNLIRDAHTNKTATAEQEQEFLNIKTTLARKQQVLGNTPIKIMNILSQATALSDMVKVQEMQAKKFYTDWHEAYLNLNELLGKLESGKMDLGGPGSVLKQKEQKRGCRGCLYNFVLLIVFIMLICICYVMYADKFNLKSKIEGTVFEKIGNNVEKIFPKKLFPRNEEIDKIEEGEKTGEDIKGESK